MKTRTAAPVLITASLLVLMSGCAGVAAQGGSVKDDLSPAANAAAVGLARGHVIVRDDLSPTRIENRITAEQASQSVQADSARAFSAEARRELHSQPQQATGAVNWTADARRELHSQPQQATSAVTWTADARRALHAAKPVAAEKPFSAAEIRELKAGAPVGVSAADMQGQRLSAYAEAQTAADVSAAEMQGARLSAFAEAQANAAIHEVDDDLSPLGNGASTPEPPADTVDDDLSPLGGSR